MKSFCFIIYPGENPSPQNGLSVEIHSFFKSIGFTSSTFPIQPDFSQNQPAAITLNAGWNPIFFKSTGFTSSTFPIQPDFSQNQPPAITLKTGSPRTLVLDGYLLLLHSLSQLVRVTIQSSVVLELFICENVIFYQEKSSMFDNVQTTYWNFVSEIWPPE